MVMSDLPGKIGTIFATRSPDDAERYSGLGGRCGHGVLDRNDPRAAISGCRGALYQTFSCRSRIKIGKSDKFAASTAPRSACSPSPRVIALPEIDAVLWASCSFDTKIVNKISNLLFIGFPFCCVAAFRRFAISPGFNPFQPRPGPVQASRLIARSEWMVDTFLD